MHYEIRNINCFYPEVVIGSSLEALTYCFLNNCPFVTTELERPHMFDRFSPQQELSLFNLENESITLYSPCGEKVVGLEKDVLWEKLYFYLGLAGLSPLADKASSIKVEDRTLKVFTNKARSATFNFNKLVVFSDEDVRGLPEPLSYSDSKYQVLDWIDVRSGMKHDFDRIVDDSKFVSEILFYPTDRVDGDHKLKDAVAISHLTKDELELYDYSDVNARFKTLYLMKKAGIRGPRNGRDTRNKSKYKYYAVRVENSHREIIPLSKSLYKSTEIIHFNNDSFCDIVKNNELKDSYVSRIFE